MLDIGIVGLGAIFKKAYLPYMLQLPNIRWHLLTRNQDVLQEISALFGNSVTYSSLDELLEVDLDGVFIHTATVAHVATASRFLKRGVPVYMDKPLAENYENSLALYELAQSSGTFLMAGFNRRFAPKVREMKLLSGKNRIFCEKNDINRPGERQFKLFDFFIHPLDTALFLADEPLKSGYFQYHTTDDGLLSQVSVTLMTASSSIVASLNMSSGSRREVIEVQTPQSTYQLEDLSDLVIYDGTTKIQKGFGSWDTTLYKRGFESSIDAFLEAVATGHNPVNAELSLLSHYICHQINQSTTSSGLLDVTLPIKEG